MKARLYIGDRLVYEKEMQPESEWKIYPVFLKGVGDDSELVARIKEALEGNRPPLKTSMMPDEQRLLNDPEYRDNWITKEVSRSSDWFSKEIEK